MMPAALSNDPVDHRSVTTHVVGGMDGVLRVVTLLRGRRYKVRRLEVELGDGGTQSRVECTVTLTVGARDLLMERLRRLPVVVSAEGS